MPRARRAYSAEERAKLWRLWKRGDRITDISKALEREPGSLYGHILARGGIAPPAAIRRSDAAAGGTGVDHSPVHRHRLESGQSMPRRERPLRGSIYTGGTSLASLDACYRQDPSIVSREIAGETILVPIRQNVGDLESIYTLNETAARVWALLDGRRSVRGVRDTIVDEFEVSVDEAEQDILELLAQLEAIGAVARE